MQITIDIDDNKVADQLLEVLERYKKKGVKITTPKHYKSNARIYTDNTTRNQEVSALDAKFKSILDKYAKERDNVSISEDNKILQDALWQKYGQ